MAKTPAKTIEHLFINVKLLKYVHVLKKKLLGD